MVDFYVRKCELDGLNFYDVPYKFQLDVGEQLYKDGYFIGNNGKIEKSKGE